MPKGKRAGKVRDKWKEKSWVVVEASPSFGRTPIAHIPSSDPEKLIGRVVDTTLYELTREDPQHYAIKMFFKIHAVDGGVARTLFFGHEYAREYLRSLIRRGSSMLTLVTDVTTKDGYVVRVQLVGLTQGRINASRKHAIRLLAEKIIEQRAASLSYDQLAQEVVLGKVASDIHNEAKKICILKHMGLKKTRLLKPGQVEIPEAVAAPPALASEA